MGAYDSSKNKEISRVGESLLSYGEARDGVENLMAGIRTMGIVDSPMGSITQVFQALEIAETHIKQQLEEVDRLRDELNQKTSELEKYKSHVNMPTRFSISARGNHVPESLITSGNGDDGMRWTDNGSASKQQDSKENGSTKLSPADQSGVDNTVASQFSSPSSRSVSPGRREKDAECGSRISPCGHGLIQIAEVNHSNSLLKQDLLAKVKEHEEEILQLRRHLSDFSMKEAHIRNEKHILEKRIAHMRLAFDQQQQDLVDAASKALSYRQEIIEENIRLTYALQEAHQEKSTFVSSLMPLLAEYNFQPSVPDAMSITSNVKVLFKHLQEKLLIAEEKLKDSQYQLPSWQSGTMNSFPQSPLRPGNHIKNGLEIVPQHPYHNAQSPIPSPPRAEMRPNWDGPAQESQMPKQKVEQENIVKSFPGSSSNNQDVPRNNEVDDHSGKEPSTHWAGMGNPPYLLGGGDDGPSSYHYLPPLMEEPGSSLSEAAEDDPLPAIEGLQINGEAYPGNQLQACGFSINGTTSCNFEWVRYREDGSLSYIEGAMQPAYLVTADDVDYFLAIEVLPLDDRKRKGEPVMVFANERRRISVDPEMQDAIAKIYHAGQMSFHVSLSAGALNIWENAVLAIKREGYSIKASGSRGVVVAEKFSPNTQVTIPCGYISEFWVQNSSGVDYMLKANNGRERDTIVLTMRLFVKRAVEKKKGKKKALFF